MTLNRPLVSIIVPIYNAEPYLEDCLFSIASQTYSNIEVILIDDGSTDNSGSIAKLFCEKDNRFQLFSQINSGVGATRNRGLMQARGDFIIYTDADDLMAEMSIDYLYDSIIENDSDIAIGAYTKQRYHKEELIKHYSDDTYSFTRKILNGDYHSSLCNKLIKKYLCKGIVFDEDIDYMEDKLFLAKILKKNDVKISIVNKNIYYYRYVENSYTNEITDSSILSSIKVTDKVCNIFQDIYSKKFIAHIKNKNKVMVLLNSQKTQRDIFPESNKYLLEDENIPLKHKLIIVSDLLHMSYPIKFYKFLNSIKSKKFI